MSETRIPLPHISVQMVDTGKLCSLQWYRYFEESVDAVLIDLASKLDKALADGYIWVGDSSGTAAAVQMSGDITMTDAGVVSIGPKKVTYSKIQDATATQRFLARNSVGAGSFEEVTLTQALDWAGNTRGSLLYRGNAGWTILIPGTSGYLLTSNGPGADPSYSAPVAGYTDEQAQDAVGNMVDVGMLYDDATPKLSVKRVICLQVTDPNGSALTVGDGKAYFPVDVTMDGYNLIAVAAHNTGMSTSGIPTVQIANVTDGVDMLSTKLTIDSGEKDSKDATTPAVIDTAHDDVSTGDELRVDVDVAGTNVRGLSVTLIFGRP